MIIYINSNPFNLNSNYYNLDININIYSIIDIVVSKREIVEEASKEGVSLDIL